VIVIFLSGNKDSYRFIGIGMRHLNLIENFSLTSLAVRVLILSQEEERESHESLGCSPLDP
jgi:hypothetical protein